MIHWLSIHCILFDTWALWYRALSSPNAQAYSLNMTYPRYMFLTYGWYEERWFAEEVQGDDCTPAQRESVLQHTLAVLQDEFLTNLSAVTDTGIVSKKLFMSVALVRLHNQGNQKVAGQQMTIVALFSGCYWTFFYLCFPSSQNGSEYQDAYTAHRNSSLLGQDKNETFLYAQHCYDATWALAFALNRTITGKLGCQTVYLS